MQREVRTAPATRGRWNGVSEGHRPRAAAVANKKTTDLRFELPAHGRFTVLAASQMRYCRAGTTPLLGAHESPQMRCSPPGVDSLFPAAQESRASAEAGDTTAELGDFSADFEPERRMYGK